jgi:protein-L-isoaspartate(D-aspartate) O-methyltransferase
LAIRRQTVQRIQSVSTGKATPMTNSQLRTNPRRRVGYSLALACSTALSIVIVPTGRLWAETPSARQGGDALATLRRAMVERDVVAVGVKNRAVLAALRATPREEFLAPEYRSLAYEDLALPIGHGQTTPAPGVVAALVERLDVRPGEKVLEIGAGCGYQTALLSRLASKVYAIEIVPELGKSAAERLDRLGYHNAKIQIGDGYQGWAEHAPFDKIVVACSPESVPPPLVEQLREGGRMLVALGDRHQQTLYSLKKVHGQLTATTLEETFTSAMSGVASAVRSPEDDAPLTPLANVGFELETLRAGKPDGWHSLRQARLDSTVLAGHGYRCLTFANRQPGRSAGAMQGMAVDGRRIQSLDVSAWIRCQQAQSGKTPTQLPRISLTFLDDNQQPITEEALGPWDGTFAWRQVRSEVLVPPQTRMALIAIGLFGAVGEASFDDIELRTAPIVAQWPLLHADPSQGLRPLVR